MNNYYNVDFLPNRADGKVSWLSSWHNIDKIIKRPRRDDDDNDNNRKPLRLPQRVFSYDKKVANVVTPTPSIMSIGAFSLCNYVSPSVPPWG